uniref:Heme O synthase n=1 Tax=Haptolina ericina TaxID=156174 RepID=A0A7S3ADQ5_9EUKA
MAAAPIDPTVAAATLGGTFLCAASANSFNQIIEIERDASMNRTMRRPLPSGRITPAHATGWAAASGLVGVGTLAVGTNELTAALGAATLGLYTLAYTPMKPLTPWNTWMGAVVGAIPPVMGWTAAGGALISAEAAALSSALFLWQMPHFLALAWMYRNDYMQGGYKMVPLTDPTGERTASLCLQYSVYLALLPPACWAAGVTSCMFAVESVGFNGLLLLAAFRFRQNHQRGQAHARRLFLASLAYLPVFFACLLLHQNRQPITARLAEEVVDDGYNDARDRLLSRGRQLCLHEHIVHPPAADADGTIASARACPVHFGKASADSAAGIVESAADSAAGIVESAAATATTLAVQKLPE